jgi:hypothetical protein
MMNKSDTLIHSTDLGWRKTTRAAEERSKFAKGDSKSLGKLQRASDADMPCPEG